MYIINTTFIIHPTVLENWKKFIKQVYIPLSLNELQFDDISVMQVLVEQEGGEKTFTVQLKSEHKQYIDFYQQQIQPRILRELTKVFKESVMHFTSIMQETSLDG